MAVETIEGSFAIAKTVSACEPGVVACYPITPSTHIAEDLDKLYADGQLKSYVAVESEFAAMSVLVGGSAAGARTFTTTSSQGLALMHEVVMAAAGMRLPIVACVANRALSAPLNIWNDHQDSISERDSGWIQLFCESNQEAVDTLPQAFKIAESAMLPVMVCVDGFYLTHAVEQIEVPEKEMVAQYLPKFSPKIKLDAAAPLSLGVYAAPENYQDFREDLAKDLDASKAVIEKCEEDWSGITRRSYGNGRWEEYRLEDAERVLVAMGSVCGNIKTAVDELRKNGEKVGLLRIKSYRPFPYDIAAVLRNKQEVGVFEKDLSFGAKAPLYSEVALSLRDWRVKVSSFIGGLGGKDVTVEHAKYMFTKMKEGAEVAEFIK
jgi:pyruvate ferredoxin oxidoreductase alpha subunit